MALLYMLWPGENKIVTRVDTGETGMCRVCVYTPRRRVKLRGVVVHLHGGGWTMCVCECDVSLQRGC